MKPIQTIKRVFTTAYYMFKVFQCPLSLQILQCCTLSQGAFQLFRLVRPTVVAGKSHYFNGAASKMQGSFGSLSSSVVTFLEMIFHMVKYSGLCWRTICFSDHRQIVSHISLETPSSK